MKSMLFFFLSFFLFLFFFLLFFLFSSTKILNKKTQAYKCLKSALSSFNLFFKTKTRISSFFKINTFNFTDQNISKPKAIYNINRLRSDLPLQGFTLNSWKKLQRIIDIHFTFKTFWNTTNLHKKDLRKLWKYVAPVGTPYTLSTLLK